MPILEHAATTSALNQGDLLCEIPLFLTSWISDSEGVSLKSQKVKHALVISRPCVLEHKSTIVVAAVENLVDQTPPTIDTLLKAKDFLEKSRDGKGKPDMFFLGHLPGSPEDGRYTARLDSLHTLQLPVKPDLREGFIAKYRKYSLHPDFTRDLHVRLFQAFAKLGFDDDQWYGTEDLRFLIQMGEAEIAAIQVEKSQALAKAKGDGVDVTKKAASLDNRISGVQSSLRPFREELARRESGSNPS